MPFGVNVYQAIAGATVSLVLGALFSERLKEGMSSIQFLIGRRRVRSLKGKWKTRWTVQDESCKELYGFDDVARIDQRGSYISGHSDVPAPDQKYKFKGRLHKETQLIGTWDGDGEGNILSGVYQLRINSDGMKLEGKWLGFEDDNSVIQGQWIMERVD